MGAWAEAVEARANRSSRRKRMLKTTAAGTFQLARKSRRAAGGERRCEDCGVIGPYPWVAESYHIPSGSRAAMGILIYSSRVALYPPPATLPEERTMTAALWMFLMAGGLAPTRAASPAAAVPLTVVLTFEANRSPSSAALLAMENEAEKVLSPAGVKLDWRLQRDLPENAEFGRMVEFELKGRCSMHTFPTLYDERGPLA